MPSAAQRFSTWPLPPHGARRWLAILVIVVFLLILIPYLIAPFYRVINPVSTLMLWRWMTGQRVERVWMPLDHIAPILPLTVILSEDGTFCRNRGIDLGAMREAIEQSGDDVAESRGASTITQQTAKNLFLWGGRSFVRKALELPLALWLNMVLPKRRVMEIYLNIVQWGPNGEFGAEAASRYAFNKPARNLNGREAAELASILPAPARRSARTPNPLVRRLAGLYERRAADFPGHDTCLRAPANAP
jgi:monofunctional glycosyltransferase